MNFLPRHSKPKMPPAAADPPPVSRAEFDELMKKITGIEQRCVRTETKVMRLMEHHGLDSHGQPLQESTTP